MSSDECTTIDKMDKRTLHLFCAQELNNNAAMCFERGLYEEATTSLHNGLKLLIAINHQRCNCSGDSTTDKCGCGNCSDSQWCSSCDHPGTLDGCIAFSEQTSFLIHGDVTNDSNSTRLCSEKGPLSDEIAVSQRDVRKNANARNSTPRKKRRLSHSRDVASGFPTKVVSSKTDNKNGYVYQRPIRIPLEGFCHCQRGYTSLLVVIVFNLAISHQRNVMDEGSCDAAKTENIAFLYKLCLDLIKQAAALASSPPSMGPSGASSTRCEMIIHNNLSQLYKMCGNNPSKLQKSLQDLLSTLMILIERGTRESTLAEISSDGWDVSTRWANTQRNGEASNLVEGILKNLDPLILHKQCADAA